MVSSIIFFLSLLLPSLLLQAGIATADNAICDPRVSANTTTCACASGDEQCSFPTCVDGCTCSGDGGGCVMNFCLTDCICPKGGCKMEACMNNCDNGGDATPPTCLSTDALAPAARGGLTPSEVCARDYQALEALTPYVCSHGEGYACCTVDLDSISPHGMDLGNCTKDLEILGVVGIANENLAAMKEARYRPTNNDIGQSAPTTTSLGFSAGLILGILCTIFMLCFWKKVWVPCFNHNAQHPNPFTGENARTL